VEEGGSKCLSVSNIADMLDILVVNKDRITPSFEAKQNAHSMCAQK
jgi:hypothetical protein